MKFKFICWIYDKLDYAFSQKFPTKEDRAVIPQCPNQYCIGDMKFYSCDYIKKKLLWRCDICSTGITTDWTSLMESSDWSLWGVKIKIQEIQCKLGFHDYVNTGIRRAYGFTYLFRCRYCDKTVERSTEGEE